MPGIVWEITEEGLPGQSGPTPSSAGRRDEPPAPSELGEDEVAAAIQLKPGASLEPIGLIRFCEERLAYFAVPRFLPFLAEMPLTENGKIKKVVPRETGVTPDMWDREAAGYKLRA